MDTRVISSKAGPDWRDDALEVLRAGGVVAAATETVYGLAGDATSDRAVAAIYAAKGRPSHNPLIAHVAGATMAADYCEITETGKRLMEASWPGPLTLVLPLKPDAALASAVTAGGLSLAVRAPQGVLGSLVEEFGRPLAAPSANRSGHVSPTTAEHVLADLEGRIPLIIDSGPTPTGLESSIVDCRTETAVLLRAGIVTQSHLEAVLGGPIASVLEATNAPVAPGQLASHYAPNAAVRLNVIPSEVQPGEAYLGFGDHQLEGQPSLSASGDLTEAASTLYAQLRALDAARPASIAVAPIPTDGLGLAINDRLKRAAAPRS